MADNRNKLLLEAHKLFAMYGYDAVGVQQIVAETGVTKPTLYHYFQSKIGLFETLIEERSVGLLNDLQQASQYQGDLVMSLTAIVRCYFEFMEQDPMFYRLMLATWFLPPSSEIFPIIAALHRKQFVLVEQLFVDATHDHGNMRGRHQQYAVSLRGMIDTYTGLALQGHITLNGEALIQRIVHQFMHGIFS